MTDRDPDHERTVTDEDIRVIVAAVSAAQERWWCHHFLGPYEGGTFTEAILSEGQPE